MSCSIRSHFHMFIYTINNTINKSLIVYCSRKVTSRILFVKFVHFSTLKFDWSCVWFDNNTLLVIKYNLSYRLFTKIKGKIVFVGPDASISPLKWCCSVKYNNPPTWSIWKCEMSTAEILSIRTFLGNLEKSGSAFFVSFPTYEPQSSRMCWLWTESKKQLLPMLWPPPNTVNWMESLFIRFYKKLLI